MTTKACDAVIEDLPAYVHGQLSPASAAPVGLHLRSCTACQAEAGKLERLESLLTRYAPRTRVSATFASTFANRLAAEIAAEEARQEQGLFAWLRRPWLIPVVATAAAAAVVLGVALQQTAKPVTVAKSGGTTEEQRPAPEAFAKSSERPQAPVSPQEKKELVMAAPPKELLERPDLFLDYPIISQLDTLGAGEHIGSESAG